MGELKAIYRLIVDWVPIADFYNPLGGDLRHMHPLLSGQKIELAALQPLHKNPVRVGQQPTPIYQKLRERITSRLTLFLSLQRPVAKLLPSGRFGIALLGS